MIKTLGQDVSITRKMASVSEQLDKASRSLLTEVAGAGRKADV